MINNILPVIVSALHLNRIKSPLISKGIDTADLNEDAVQRCDEKISRAEVLDLIHLKHKITCDHATHKDKEWIDGYEEGIDQAIAAVCIASSADSSVNLGNWIPFKERKPKKPGLYLTLLDSLTIIARFDGHKFRTRSGVVFIPDVWQDDTKQSETAETDDQCTERGDINDI